MARRQQALDEVADQIEYEALPIQYKQMLQMKNQVEEEMLRQRIREQYKGPYAHDETLLAHFYNR